jgi:hypothetical protein
MPGGRTFLVERYIPQLQTADVELLARRLANASAQLRAEGRDIHWLRSLAIPNDETCLCTFSAHTRSDVEEANRRADATYERIVDTVALENTDM